MAAASNKRMTKEKIEVNDKNKKYMPLQNNPGRLKSSGGYLF